MPSTAQMLMTGTGSENERGLSCVTAMKRSEMVECFPDRACDDPDHNRDLGWPPSLHGAKSATNGSTPACVRIVGVLLVYTLRELPE